MRKILVILVILVIAVLLCGSTTVPPAQDDDGGAVFLLKETRVVYVYDGVSGGWGLYDVGVDPVSGTPVLLGSLATSRADTLGNLRTVYDRQARAFEKSALYYNTRTGKFN